MNTRNKKIVYTLIGIAAVILVTIAITYAYWLITRSQTGSNIISSACLNITLTNEQNDIELTNQFPLSDADGMISYKSRINRRIWNCSKSKFNKSSIKRKQSTSIK